MVVGVKKKIVLSFSFSLKKLGSRKKLASSSLSLFPRRSAAALLFLSLESLSLSLSKDKRRRKKKLPLSKPSTLSFSGLSLFKRRRP
jgi:hypothetical protein